MKISANVWNKFTEAEKDLFRLCCYEGSGNGSNDIKRYIKAIKAKFGAVENVKARKNHTVIFNSTLYVWNGDKTWYEHPTP